MTYTKNDLALFESIRRMDADCAELSDISGFSIFVGKRIDGEDGEHDCLSVAQFSDPIGLFKVATAIASDEDIYERFIMLAALTQEVYDAAHPDDEDEEENN